MFRVEVNNSGDTTFQVVTKDGTLTLGPEGNSITPLDNFLASLGACIGFYIRLFCSKNSITLAKFQVIVQAQLTDERPYLFNEIDVAIALGDTELDPSMKEQLVEFAKNCPLQATLTASPKINVRVE
jgi:uncharacterized OsmC-like protein